MGRRVGKRVAEHGIGLSQGHVQEKGGIPHGSSARGTGPKWPSKAPSVGWRLKKSPKVVQPRKEGKQINGYQGKAVGRAKKIREGRGRQSGWGKKEGDINGPTRGQKGLLTRLHLGPRE